MKNLVIYTILKSTAPVNGLRLSHFTEEVYNQKMFRLALDYLLPNEFDELPGKAE